ncbi:MAG TPA: serine/threonine-protein kinase [Ktedonobacteraceae bacterium]
MLLKERYRIINQIGQGGQATIYKGEDTELGNRLVAIKEMSQDGLSPNELQEAADAFKREAHMLAGLQHPNIPSIYDYFHEAGHWYFVMEFIEGETLEDYFSRAAGGTLPVKEVLDIGIQLCSVLEYLHNHQPPIIFRDLKPGNVMRAADGHLYLIDFGIARHFKPGRSRDTTALGSLGYAAPEQYGKAQTTARSDIYSLGVILHQALTGNDPTSNKPTMFDFPSLNLPGEPAAAELQKLLLQMLDRQDIARPDSTFVKQELQRIAAGHTMPLPPTASYLRVSSQPVISAPSVPAREDISGNVAIQVPATRLSAIPSRRKFTRRMVIVSLAAVTGLALAGSGIAWLVNAQQAAPSIGTISSPQARSTPTQRTTVNTVHIYDRAGVLQVEKVQSEAAKLPYPIDIYTVNDFSGTTTDFDQRTRSQVTTSRLMVIAIDTVHRHVYITGGPDVPLRSEQYQSAANSFVSNFQSGNYTGATIAAILSLQNSLA